MFGVGTDAMELSLSNNQKNVICFVTLLARRVILLNWKPKKTPIYLALMNDVMKHLQLEKIKFTLRGKINMFNSIWQPFMDH